MTLVGDYLDLVIAASPTVKRRRILAPAMPCGRRENFGTQLHWLERTLAGHRADRDIDWIVAFFHECAFSTCGDHSFDSGVRSAIAPLFARYEVDLVVQGHNHLYERSNPIRYDPHTNTGHSSIQAVAHSPQNRQR